MTQSDIVRCAFHDSEGFLISADNLPMSDQELQDYLSVAISGELPDHIRRITLYSRNRPFRRIAIDLQ